jgi:hypothetical protein
MTMACFASPHYLGCPVHIDRTRARAENQVSEQAAKHRSAQEERD